MLSRENAWQLMRFYKKLREQKSLQAELFNVPLSDYMAQQKSPPLSTSYPLPHVPAPSCPHIRSISLQFIIFIMIYMIG